MSPVQSFHENIECPIQKIETPSELRLEWNNRTARQDRFLFWALLTLWIIWAALTVFVTSLIFRPRDDLFQTLGLCFWSFFAWLATILVPYVLLQRYWRQWITISRESLAWGSRGLFALKPKCIPMANVVEIKIGRYDDPNDPESHESVVTLNVFCLTPKGRKRRHIIAYWIHPNLKEKVFGEMQEFCGRNEIPLSFQRY